MRELVNRVISLSDGTVAEGSTLFGGRNTLYPVLQVLDTIIQGDAAFIDLLVE